MPSVQDTDPNSSTWGQTIQVTDEQLAMMRKTGQSINHQSPAAAPAAATPGGAASPEQISRLKALGVDSGYIYNSKTGQIELPGSNFAQNAAWTAKQQAAGQTAATQAQGRSPGQLAMQNANNVMGTTSGQATGLFSQAQQSPYSAPSITGQGGMFAPPAAARTAQAAPAPSRASGMFAGATVPAGTTGRGQAFSPLPSLNLKTASAGPSPAPRASAPPAFQTGQQLARPATTAAPANIAGQLGAAPTVGSVANVSGNLGAAPKVGNVAGVAGKLGSVPQAAAVGGIAGQLGAGPTVGNVANIAGQLGAAPGAITGQLGNMGQSSANQASMFGRVNSFLDAPDGPSVAQAQLQSAQADNMANLIGAARSGRGGAGASAQALRGAVSEGGAIASDTAGQMATLRAQEEDMRRNRQLSAIGLGGQIATDMRGQDLGFRGQDLSALQADQSTALGARGQNLGALTQDQGTQLALQQLGVNAGLTTRGQNLSALQGDQSTAAQMSLGNLQASLTGRGQDLGALQGDQSSSLGLEQLRAQTALGARGQNLSAMQGDQSTGLGLQQLMAQTALGARGQNLGALQSDQSTQLGARGQNIDQNVAYRGQDVATRGQDLTALMSDADRQMAAQDMNLRRQLGLTNLGIEAQGQGYNFLLGSQGQNLGSEQVAQNAYQSQADRDAQMQIAAMQAANGQTIANINRKGNKTDYGPAAIGAAATLGGVALSQLGGSSDPATSTGGQYNTYNGAPIAPLEPYSAQRIDDDNPYY